MSFNTRTNTTLLWTQKSVNEQNTN